MNWMTVLQIVMIMFVLTFSILLILSFVQSGQRQAAKDKLEQTKAEIELATIRGVWKGNDDGAR